MVLKLSRKPQLNAAELHLAVNAAAGRTFSVQAVYKELRKLQNRGVIVKLGELYSLNLSWISALLDLADTMYDNYLAGGPLSVLLPAPKEQAQWRFTTLSQANDFWIQLMLICLSNVRGEGIYQWCPHPWYVLLASKEVQFVEALRHGKYRLYSIIGGDSDLDISLCKAYCSPQVQVSHAEGPFESQRGVYLNLVGDYLISVKLEPVMAKEIDRIFESKDSPHDRSRELYQLLTLRTKVKVVIENTPGRSPRLRKAFMKFFGVR